MNFHGRRSRTTIVTHEVTNDGSDRSQLSAVAKEAKATLGVEQLDAVADRGYFDSEEILACENAGITVTLPKPMTSNSKAQGRFGKQDFRYLAEEDVYICPAGEKLAYRYTTEENGLVLRRYGPMPVRAAPSSKAVLPARSDGSRDGSMSTFSRQCSAGSTNIRKRCVCGARRLSTPSERSRPGWVQPTS
jgi:hypothetical protein